MTDPIDYSRPVGWWCTYCEEDGPCTRTVNLMGWCCDRIPRYLPIPEGQRPPAASEVEDAEVVTGCAWGHWAIRPNPQTWSGWHGNITDALIDEITGATE